MKKATITDVKLAAKEAGFEVKRHGTLNNCPAYKVLTADRERLLTKKTVIEMFMRGDFA